MTEEAEVTPRQLLPLSQGGDGQPPPPPSGPSDLAPGQTVGTGDSGFTDFSRQRTGSPDWECLQEKFSLATAHTASQSRGGIFSTHWQPAVLLNCPQSVTSTISAEKTVTLDVTWVQSHYDYELAVLLATGLKFIWDSRGVANWSSLLGWGGNCRPE